MTASRPENPDRDAASGKGTTSPTGERTPEDIHDLAQWYAAEFALRVFPLRLDDRKKPAISNWPQVATTDAVTIERWWGEGGQFRGHGIGIACGKGSNLIVIDVDVKDGKQGDAQYRQIEAECGQLPPTPTVHTPTGGWHVYLKWPGFDPMQKVLDADIEVQAEGHFAVAPPSMHPGGGTYVWDDELRPSRLGLSECPSAWVERLRLVEPTADGGDRHPDYAKVLTAAGWVLHGIDRLGRAHWTRPGKDVRHGSSGTEYPGADHHFIVWSTSVRGLEVRRPYQPDELARLLKVPGALGDVEEETEWTDPVPLTGVHDLPPFPTESFPSWVGAFARGLAEETQTPTDMPGVLMLAALATAAGGGAVVQVRPGWVEPTNLFLAVATPSGTRKSAVFSAIVAPLAEYERSKQDELRPTIVEESAAKRAKERIRDAATADAAKAEEKDREKLLKKAKAAALAAESITVPICPTLIADDVTVEALGTLMVENGGRIAVLAPEGDIFDLMAGRYSTEANFGLYLRAHQGDAYRLHRKGRPAEHLARPAITLGLAVQPAVLQALTDRPGFRGRGLLARFLYSLPVDNVGHRSVNATPMTGAVRERYSEQLTGMVKVLIELTDPQVLTLDTEARDRVVEYLSVNEARLRPGGTFDQLRDWGSKLTGAAVRIAGLLHLAEHPGDGYRHPIEVDTVERAVAIGEYFVPHALAVFDLMATDPEQDTARRLLAWMERKGMEEFSQRDAHQAHRSIPVDRIAKALGILVAYGWLRRVRQQKGAGRPPSPRFQVHPDLSKTSEPQNGGF